MLTNKLDCTTRIKTFKKNKVHCTGLDKTVLGPPLLPNFLIYRREAKNFKGELFFLITLQILIVLVNFFNLKNAFIKCFFYNTPFVLEAYYYY